MLPHLWSQPLSQGRSPSCPRSRERADYGVSARLHPSANGKSCFSRFLISSVVVPFSAALSRSDLRAPKTSSHESRWASCVAALTTGTADELVDARGNRATACLEDLFPGHPGGLVLQHFVQFPPPLEDSAFHRCDREPHDPR